MQTHVTQDFLQTESGKLVESILRRCVHCGFCTATCPTYQITGDELDSPRGRIYQIKQVFEGMAATPSVQRHLDRCLTCRNCETTCPSGVQYGRLLDLGREEVERQVRRRAPEAFKRWLLRRLMGSRVLFHRSYRLAQLLCGRLPETLRGKILPRQNTVAVAPQPARRKMVLLAGCVQPTLLPGINHATVKILNALRIEAVVAAQAGCCGAVNLHLNAPEAALADMRRNIDAWWPHVEAGAEAVLLNASGCGVMVKDYAFHLRHDAAYAAKAQKISTLCRDAAEIVAAETAVLRPQLAGIPQQAVAYHPPCTLQHGQKQPGSVEAVLAALGIGVMLPEEAHLCCGSAGTYAFFHPNLSQTIKQRKQAHLAALQPHVVLSANVGCIAHLSNGSAVPVRHWLEYVADLLN